MSIIYDALKKVEASRSKTLEVQIDKPAKSRFKIYLIYALVGGFGLFMANMLYGIFIKDSVPTLVKDESGIDKRHDIYTYQEPSPAIASVVSKVTEKEPPVLPSLVLNGVFFSEDGACALINNQIIRKGDVIDGAKVMQINLNAVELEFEGSTTKLSYVR